MSIGSNTSQALTQCKALENFMRRSSMTRSRIGLGGQIFDLSITYGRLTAGDGRGHADRCFLINKLFYYMPAPGFVQNYKYFLFLLDISLGI